MPNKKDKVQMQETLMVRVSISLHIKLKEDAIHATINF